MAVKICSMNTRGLQNEDKRRSVFAYLREEKVSIWFLQETHCGPNQDKLWKKEWGQEAFFSNISKSSVGVGILLNGIKPEIKQQIIDPMGRYILLDVQLAEKRVLLCNIYAPNENSPDFFESIAIILENQETTEIILGGDMNCVLDPHLDKMGGQRHCHQHVRGEIQRCMEEFDLNDVWRMRNRYVRRYTWRQPRPLIQCRLDYFLVSTSLLGLIEKEEIKPGFKTDHSIISLNLQFASEKRGTGFWKFNASLLLDTDYCNLIKEAIAQSREINAETDPQLMWDTIKCAIRTETIQYSRKKQKQSREKLVNLQNNLDHLEQMLNTSTTVNDSDLLEDITQTKNKIEEIYDKRLNGIKLRSKARWVEEGEKSSRYFMNLEKRNYERKIMNRLATSDGRMILEPGEIRKEQANFYQNLYKSTSPSSEYEPFFPENGENPKLDELEKESCEGKITKEECLEALKSMKNNKSPGTDGLTVEFYKHFWQEISEPLVNSLNAGYDAGKMSTEQRRGIITLIPKKEKDPLYLKNWRPISLLNVDYKIATKAIAGRIKMTLNNLIARDQTGFLKNRYIGENIRLILDMIEICHNRKIPGLIFFLDFEKAFDSVEWSFLYKALEYFNFGPMLRHWVEAFYTDVSCCTINNGHTSRFFSLERGMRQGCPLSPYLFIICAEVLAIRIRSGKVKGLKLGNIECKLSQYADDTTIFMEPKETNLREIIKVLEEFGKISGLKANLEKSEILRIGDLAHSHVTFCPEYNIKWTNGPVRALGVHLTANPSDYEHLNYVPTMKQIEKTLRAWSSRDLTLIGKATILKAFALSKLTFLFSVLPSPSPTFLKELNKIIFNFVWSGKSEKIKRKVLINTFEKGGVKIPDPQSFDKAIKVTWVKRILNPNVNTTLKRLMELSAGVENIEAMLKGNLKSTDEKVGKISNRFLQDFMKYWSEVNFKAVSDVTDPLTQHLWYNSNIRSEDSVMYNARWYSKDIVCISDILQEGTLLAWDQFQVRYNLPTGDFLYYYRLIKSIPKQWTSVTDHDVEGADADGSQNPTMSILCISNICRWFYPMFLKQTAIEPSKSQQYWTNEVGVIGDWEQYYCCLHNCTISNKLKMFQYKFLNRAVILNKILFYANKIDSPKCTLCNDFDENMLHLFWECAVTKQYLADVMQRLHGIGLVNPNWNKKSFLLGDPEERNIVNFTLILVKFVVYRCKIQQTIPKLSILKSELLKWYDVEELVYSKRGDLDGFEKRWNVTRNSLVNL